MSELDLRTNPYVGLRPFFSDDSLYFFGRGQQTTELLEILHQNRFLGIVGSSGSGKSSLVRAGLLPKLLGGFLVQDRDRWRTVQVKPGDAPTGNLAAGLLKAVGEKATPEANAELEQAIRDAHTEAVVEFLVQRLENANVFLLVDQFEEIFAFRGNELDEGPRSVDPARQADRARRKAEATDFVNLLLALSERRELPIYVALTMRTDFLGDCDLFYGFPEALNRGRYLVPRMTRQQLREAIAGPAMLMRTAIAPRLLDHLLNELGDRFDRLPVLQHALLRTWDAWQRSGGIGSIDLHHFATAGGLERALDQDAESALTGLDVETTARVFKRLTDTDVSQRRIRSPARISELAAAAGVARNVVEEIVHRFQGDGRSFVFTSDDGKPDDPRVDISHESLIRQWERLRNWVDEERRSRDQYVELADRARKREHDEASLLQDPELEIVLDWREKETPTPAWAARYSANGDFESAVRYLDESNEVRCQHLAELELERRWHKVWRPVIVLALVLAGAWSLDRAGVFRGGLPSLRVDSWDAVKPWLLEYAKLGFFFVIGLALLGGGRRVHRSIAFPGILRDLRASGGRNSIEKRAAELQDAVVAHNTTYASTGRRVVGYLIDWFPYLPLCLVVMMILIAVEQPGEEEISNAITVVWYAGCAVIAWLYATLQLASKRQATLGMRAVGIFRTGLYGERLSFARASLWYAYRVLSYAGFGLGFFIQPFTSKRQTFHDRMAKTVVLRRRPADVASP